MTLLILYYAWVIGLLLFPVAWGTRVMDLLGLGPRYRHQHGFRAWLAASVIMLAWPFTCLYLIKNHRR